ncbi:peroxisomal acyl-coenzyme A oxidase 1 [Gigaspora margarita]|uniref:Acyl-coenzyme A oxidase n=1 Tax=Gigaspora margarita TaxID=4874 RepID=A0A8H4AGG5_GIGMA|nr:peroxisomal acyl-coenzyme A oxidase 1 [Gigaspora margarita]
MVVNVDLANARKAVSFPVEELTHFINGGPEKTVRRRWLRSLVDPQNDPIFSNINQPFLSRDQYYILMIKRFKKMLQLKKLHNLQKDDWGYLIIFTMELSISTLHDLFFTPTLERQMSEEQSSKWFPLAKEYSILGCYLQTELGHGSNVRKLETTATYIHETDEFEIHSPTLTSIKWWPGALARTSTHGILFARLIIDKKDYGIHSFIVQLRDERHKPMPGIEIGDVGPKYGYNYNDNGFLRFTQVRIPRENMLMRFSKVSRSGHYSTPPHAKIIYDTLVSNRINFLELSTLFLSKALTIAIRYSLVRKQGDDYKDLKNENLILDYQSQQYKLFSGLALLYASFFNKIYMQKLYENYIKNIGKIDDNLMAEVHASSAGLKALCTDLVLEAIENARQSCGGHGYSQLSGIPNVLTYYAHLVSAEGENTIMYLQTGRYLLKSFLIAKKGSSTGGRLSHLSFYSKILMEKCAAETLEDLLDAETQLCAFRHMYLRLLSDLNTSIETSATTHPHGYDGSKADHMIDIVHLSRAYCHYITLINSHEGLQSVKKEQSAIYPILRALIDLYFINAALNQSGDFLIDGYYTSHHISLLKQGQKKLLNIIRPEAIGLVDAWEYCDNNLNSALGREDGNVYETLYEWVKMEPMNILEKQGKIVGYDEGLKDILTGKYLKEIKEIEIGKVKPRL